MFPAVRLIVGVVESCDKLNVPTPAIVPPADKAYIPGCTDTLNDPLALTVAERMLPNASRKVTVALVIGLPSLVVRVPVKVDGVTGALGMSNVLMPLVTVNGVATQPINAKPASKSQIKLGALLSVLPG